MSDYTTQLRFICESYAGKRVPTPQAEIDEIIAASRADIFNFDYPIFDPAYKETLETKILSHYYTEEIGSETVGLWKHQLKNKMREIMPFYNQLYMSEKIKFDPLVNTMLDDSRQTAGETTAKGQSDTDRVSILNYEDHKDIHRQGSAEADSTTDNTGRFAKDSTGSEQTSNARNTTDGLTENTSDTKAGTETGEHTGTDTLHYMGKAEKSDVLKKEGSELTVDLPAHNMSVLHKHSDTPLGGIDGTTDGSQVPAISGGGSGAVANYSNYLSDVTEDVSNFDKNPALGSGSNRKRNRQFVRQGYYFNPEGASPADRNVEDPRKDTHTVVEDYSKYDSTAPRQDQQTKNLTDETTYDITNTGEKTSNRTGSEQELGNRSNRGSETGSDESHNVSRETSSETSTDSEVNIGDRNGNDRTQTSNEGSTTENKDYFGRLFGKTGSVSFSKLLMEYRQTFLNIDMQVIDALQPLFMGIW